MAVYIPCRYAAALWFNMPLAAVSHAFIILLQQSPHPRILKSSLTDTVRTKDTDVSGHNQTLVKFNWISFNNPSKDWDLSMMEGFVFLNNLQDCVIQWQHSWSVPSADHDCGERPNKVCYSTYKDLQQKVARSIIVPVLNRVSGSSLWRVPGSQHTQVWNRYMKLSCGLTTNEWEGAVRGGKQMAQTLGMDTGFGNMEGYLSSRERVSDSVGDKRVPARWSQS